MLLGAWPRSPARPRRPRGGLQSGEACSCEWPPGPAAAHRHRGQALRSLLIGGLPACLLVAPRVFRAPEAPAAREARASLRSAPRLEARPCPPGPPAPSTPVGPGRCSAALHIGLKPGQAPPPSTGITNLSRETGVAFACAGSAPTETGVAFAGEKWVFLAWFSVALVMLVSRWSASVVAEVSLVSTSSRHSCLCAKKFALLGPMVGASAKKFALRAKNGQKLAVYGVLGELFRGRADGWVVRGELFATTPLDVACWASFFAG